MAAVHHRGHAVEARVEEPLIRLDLEHVGHVAVVIGQHAVKRDDRKPLDPK